MTGESTSRTNSSASKKTTFLSAYGLFFTGLFVIMVSVAGSEIWHWPVWLSAFVRDVGLLLSAVMAGTLLHEKLLRDEMVKVVGEELEQKLDERIPKVREALDETNSAAAVTLERKLAHVPSAAAKEVHRLFSESPPGMTGIKLLSEVRRGFGGYYAWVNHQKPQELFFAGRSVLHRIDADIRSKTDGSAENVLFRRLNSPW